MTAQQAYEKRNLQGFEGDEIMADKIRQLIRDFKVDLVIEGGTYLGGTTKRLALMCNDVVTIEVNPDYYLRAKDFLAVCKKVQMYYGSTVQILPEVLEIYKNRNILFFSDAHWEEHNPMLEELEIIRKAGIKPVICIHDFKVPGKPEFGFDTYKNIIYEWNWIRESIERIYGVGKFKLEYNERAGGAKRGIIYITPL